MWTAIGPYPVTFHDASVSDFWLHEFFLHEWIWLFLGLFKPETQGKWRKKLKKLCNPPWSENAAECLWPKQPSPSSSSRTTCPSAMPTFLAFHHISWESPISSDLVTKCLPDLLSGKNSCYSWHIQMPVQILGTPLWGVHFISLQQENISLIQRKTLDHGIAD